MRDWNSVITVFDGAYNDALRILHDFGAVQKSDFYNVLLMKTADSFQVLQALHEERSRFPAIDRSISRFMPLESTFTFQSPEEFELRCQENVLAFIPRLENARFHVRMHRRGFKGKLSSIDEERFLDEFLLHHLARAGTPGTIAFDDPDAVIALETVGTQGGMSLFGREQLARFPLLHLD